jgi:GWxTD domain-containing protein
MEITKLWMSIMKTKLMIALLLLVGLNLFAAEKLGMFIEVKRFLNEKKNTTFDIDYQVPYRNLKFESLPKDKKHIFADLDVKILISNQDSVIIKKDFSNNIGVSNSYDVTSTNKSYLDRISLTLAKPGMSIKILFNDVKGDKSYEWDSKLELLKTTDKLSDVEILNSISPDTTLYSQKFIQDGMSYIPEPSGLVSKDIQDSMYLYCEAYAKYDESKVVLTILKDTETILIQSNVLQKGMITNHLLYPINLSALDTGKYHGTIELTDQEGIFTKAYEFILTEQTERLYFIFTESDDEYQLLKYIGNVKPLTSWKSMSKEAKRRYISQFWVTMASQRNQSVEEILKIYRDRVEYSNNKFSHFEKGWKTDRGRIYIRNGMPADITDDSTQDTRFVKKDYEVWKYTTNNHPAYIFVDIAMNGNYKLVYAKNDEQESTNPDWRKYMGNDFDETTLEKSQDSGLDNSDMGERSNQD